MRARGAVGYAPRHAARSGALRRRVALTVMLGAPCVRAAEDAPGRVVRYGKDALSVRLVHAPVSEVLAELSRQSGAEIRGQVSDPRELTAEFDAMPLREATLRAKLHRPLSE